MMENEMRKLIDRVRNFGEKLNEQKKITIADNTNNHLLLVKRISM